MTETETTTNIATASPSEGERRIIKEDVAQSLESRIYIGNGAGRLIGRADHIRREHHSRYNWLLIGAVIDTPIEALCKAPLHIWSETWRMNCNIFHEGYGWMATTTHVKPEEQTPVMEFKVTRWSEAVPNNELATDLHFYRYITLERIENVGTENSK